MDTREFIKLLGAKLEAGATIAIHCRAGIGRSSLIAACLLAQQGIEARRAFETISAARRVAVPDTDQQAAWVAKFVP